MTDSEKREYMAVLQTFPDVQLFVETLSGSEDDLSNCVKDRPKAGDQIILTCSILPSALSPFAKARITLTATFHLVSIEPKGLRKKA